MKDWKQARDELVETHHLSKSKGQHPQDSLHKEVAHPSANPALFLVTKPH
jgi:hypothetical protein